MKPVSEEELHAYVDGQLPPERRDAVAARLAADADAAEEVAAYRRQNEALHALFDPVLAESPPAGMKLRPRRRYLPPLRLAAGIGWLGLGLMLGWLARGQAPMAPMDLVAAMPRQAAVAHVVYTPEVRHPVEVGADQEAHLAAWLSKRLGAEIKPPQLAGLGYQLMGGRLLPSDQGPAAQFMYQDLQGQRLTLYVRSAGREKQETAFRFAQEGKVSVFYWIDGPLGYALSGEMPREKLLQVATAVYQGLNP